MAMTFGVHVGHLASPLAELRKLRRFADTSGCDWFSVSDHFQESPLRERRLKNVLERLKRTACF